MIVNSPPNCDFRVATINCAEILVAGFAQVTGFLGESSVFRRRLRLSGSAGSAGFQQGNRRKTKRL